MKISLKTNLDYYNTLKGPSKEKESQLPCLRIPVDEKNKKLLNSIPESGTAKITFKVKKLSIGEEYDGSQGCVELEISDIDLPNGSEPMLSMDAKDALDAFMKKKDAKEYEEEGDE